MATEKEPKIDLSTLELMKEFARELKKPSEEEQAKIDAEKIRQKQSAEASVAMAKQEEESIRRAQANCSHHNGKHPLFVGNKCTNGDFVAQCLRCGLEYRWDALEHRLSAQEGFMLSEAIAPLPPGAAERQLQTTEKTYPPRIKAKRHGA